jgi:hypothetical protein
MLCMPGFVHSGEAWHGWVLAEEFREPQDCLAVAAGDVRFACLLEPFPREAGHCTATNNLRADICAGSGLLQRTAITFPSLVMRSYRLTMKPLTCSTRSRLCPKDSHLVHRR